MGIVPAVALLASLSAAGSAPPGICAAQRQGRGAASRAWEKIEPECRKKLEANRTAAALRCLEGAFLEARGPGHRDGDWRTTLRKLRHDAEMFTWLEQEGRVATEVKTLFRQMYLSAREGHEDKPDKVFEVNFGGRNEHRRLWQKAHNKAVHIDPSAKESPKRTVRASQAALLEAEEKMQAGGHAVIDRLLADTALSPLRNFLQASTFYFYTRPGGHLLALLEDGLASPLLAALSQGLQAALPKTLGSLLFTGARAWKADNSGLDARIPVPELNSSSDAAVNLLLWTVPSSALNGSAMAALTLRRRPQRPEDAPDEVLVKYAANRAVIWSGDEVDAEWTGPGWKSGFLKRGIHLLLQFGWSRCEEE